jgi:ComF family protein
MSARVLGALLPQDCVLCGAPSGDRYVCSPCAAELPWLGDGCPQCALPSPGGRVCGRCLARPPAYDATLACFAYEFPIDRLVHALKYGGRLALSRWFAWCIAERCADRESPDRILAMPLHRTRLAERGFNQSLEIARHLARSRGLDLAAEAVIRLRATAPQVDLPLDERSRNVKDAFACTAPVQSAHVAVVDDVMTSGATLDELARTLKRAGAARVTNWVVARTV